MNQMMDRQNDKFIKEYDNAILRAGKVFQERKAEGRNAFMPPIGMFCFGTKSAITLIWMKVCRLVGNERVGNNAKIIEECEDIINYAAMTIAYIRSTTEE